MVDDDDKPGEAFRTACYYGQFEIVKWLWKISKEFNSPININAGHVTAFEFSCAANQIEIAKWLWNLGIQEKTPINLKFGNHYAFRISCMMNHVQLSKWLCTLNAQYLIEEIDNKINYEIIKK